ncbi:unnamed protein product [Kuraishia capsulata CBS 1993]|uniref:Uncharacterized protein n=1 Tax=Kuraishia capsulata CBS 1993 TaxID=1382522 RepID=W6MTV8_9ASCO|nr:uncharacterized protein KUCA_T00004681001 [Kuraishia capsulata CBS 1993]CDK28697.1 unnamed protein product [Kuraishia capsulata CBS 1993]
MQPLGEIVIENRKYLASRSPEYEVEYTDTEEMERLNRLQEKNWYLESFQVESRSRLKAVIKACMNEFKFLC